MPPDPRASSRSQRPSSSSQSRSSGRPPSSSQRPSSSSQQPSSSSSSRSRPKSSEDIRQAEYEKFLASTLPMHLGVLFPPFRELCEHTGLTPRDMALALAPCLLALHVSLPLKVQPHITYFLMIQPLNNTLKSLADTKRLEAGLHAPQWLAFWLFWFAYSGLRGWVGVWRPGWMRVVELGGLVGVVSMAGPWWSRGGMRGPQSEEYKKALEREETEAKEREEKEAKRAKEKEQKEAKQRQDEERRRRKKAEEAKRQKA